jgi:hypothetical protein
VNEIEIKVETIEDLDFDAVLRDLELGGATNTGGSTSNRV